MFNSKEYHKAYYLANKDRMLAQAKAKRTSLPAEETQRRKVDYGIKQRERYKQQRLDCLKQYGNKCICCGEDRPEFLSFDHIAGGGTKHRRMERAGRITIWLTKNGYPPGFQILCHNCNMAKGFYGQCPHQVEKV